MRVDTAISESLLTEGDALLEGLTLHDWAALPLRTRVTCRLFDVLTALDALWLDLQTEEGNTLRWLEPHLRAVSDEVEKIMERLAS